MEQINITPSEAIIYIAILNVIFGFFLGFFPLLVGLILKNRKLGIYGFIVSMIGGGILGIFLSYPIALVFTWIIIRRSKEENGEDAKSVDNNDALENEMASASL